MPKYMKNFLTLVGVIIIGSFLAFLYNCITGLATFAGNFNPTLTPWVFWILFGSVSAMLAWLAAMAFMRPKPMMVYADPTEADMQKFKRELHNRLRKNKFLRETKIDVSDENNMEAGLTALSLKANEEIKSTAKRVFIGTAVSQNGRLDTLVVLYLITRLTWRIAKLYNQRPHYRELINLYANIAATSFLAGSIEEFGIEDYVRELMGPLMGGSAIGAVPGAQAIASTITTSVLTGSTNSLLALRCGIVARDYVSLNLNAKGAMRRSATVEASKMFVTMSAETVTYVTKLLVQSSTGAVKTGTIKAVKGVGTTISNTAGSVGNGAKKVGQGVKGTAGAVGRGVKGTAETVGDGAKKAGQGMKHTAESVSKGMKDTFSTVGDSAKKVRQEMKHKAETVGQKVKDTVEAMGTNRKKVRQNMQHAAEDLGNAARQAGQEAKETGLQFKEKIKTTLHEGVETIESAKGATEAIIEDLKQASFDAGDEPAPTTRKEKRNEKTIFRTFSEKLLRRKKK